jgi:2,3-bisphosphoglycerate-independent phosphoglycerate mutase
MKPNNDGEGQPRFDDDRLPIVLVVLDGLGDRAIPELDGRTPSEAAVTPVLDRLTQRGASGWCVPFGWGLAPASELAHWAMFGFTDVPFPGRAVLEGIGAGLDLPLGTATTFASLRTSRITEGRIWITGRAAPDDMMDADALLVELGYFFEEHSVRLDLLGRGEALLQFDGHAAGSVTDSDPFFENIHPWLRVRATDPTGAELAEKMNALLLKARHRLLRSEVNRARMDARRPALDTLTTKWSGAREVIPTFIEQTGIAGAAVTDARMYRGLAEILGLTQQYLAPGRDYAADLAERIQIANKMIAAGARFVHVHSKVTDEAGHTKDPWAKLKALEALDPGLDGLETLADRAIVAVTGDHATPSVDGVLHTGDPTPLVLVGPTVRPDAVMEFGERHARHGWYGVVQARELLPLMLSHANRPMFLGHRATPRQTLGLPDHPEPMPLIELCE